MYLNFDEISGDWTDSNCHLRFYHVCLIPLKRQNAMKNYTASMAGPAGIEPASRSSEPRILSVVLRSPQIGGRGGSRTRVSSGLSDALFTCLDRAWFPVRAAAAVFPAGFSGNAWPRTIPDSEDDAFNASYASPLFMRNVAARRLTYRCVSIKQQHDIHRHLNFRPLLTRIRRRGMHRRQIESVDRY